MKRLFLLCMFICGIIIQTQAQDRHELENMRVKIQSHEYNKSRKIEKDRSGLRDYISGEPSAYLLSRTKPLTKILAPSAEYLLQSGMAGGTYQVTIVYRAEKDKNYTGNPEIIIGFDELPSKEIELDYTKSVKRKSIDFKVNVLRGKKHRLKIWLTTPNVEIDYIEGRRKLINS